MNSYKITHLESPLKLNSNYGGIIGFISFWIFKIKKYGSQKSVAIQVLGYILEDFNMLHELFFVSKAPCLSIILSFRIKRMLSIEEYRTMLINFCVQT